MALKDNEQCVDFVDFVSSGARDQNAVRVSVQGP